MVRAGTILDPEVNSPILPRRRTCDLSGCPIAKRSHLIKKRKPDRGGVGVEGGCDPACILTSLPERRETARLGRLASKEGKGLGKKKSRGQERPIDVPPSPASSSERMVGKERSTHVAQTKC